MGNSTKAEAHKASEVYSAFRKLSAKRRLDLALRILKDEQVLADLYDHLLIKRAVDEPGASIGWVEYRNGAR